MWSHISVSRPAGPRPCASHRLLRDLALLAAEWFSPTRISPPADNSLYADEVIFSRNTRYQHIVLTKWKDDLRLFLNTHLQFSSRDEYRYHEALVHPGLAAIARRAPRAGVGRRRRAGHCARSLKYPQLESITLVDLDPEMTRLFSIAPHADRTQSWQPSVAQSARDQRRCISVARFQLGLASISSWRIFPIRPIIRSASFTRLRFYRPPRRHLSAQGLMVVQSTSPMFARDSYWCIAATVKQAGLQTYPYHVYVPSFGEWGFVIGCRARLRAAARACPRACVS